MAQPNKHSRALRDKGSLAARFHFVRQSVYAMVLATLLWSTQAAAQAMPPSCPFDNVYHTGQMSCNSVLEHKIWFTNGSSSTIQDGCQNYLIPVERIVERNPASQTAAAISVPSKYTVTRTFYNTRSLVTFDSFSIVPAGEQIILEITAVLDDPSANSPSTQFVNTAKWDFGTYEIAAQ